MKSQRYITLILWTSVIAVFGGCSRESVPEHSAATSGGFERKTITWRDMTPEMQSNFLATLRESVVMERERAETSRLQLSASTNSAQRTSLAQEIAKHERIADAIEERISDLGANKALQASDAGAAQPER